MINPDNAASEWLDCIRDYGLVMNRGRKVGIYCLPTAAWEGAQEEAWMQLALKVTAGTLSMWKEQHWQAH